MRKPVTYFEQIPVQKVKKMVEAAESQGIESLTPSRVRLALQCRICRKPVPVETAKTDDRGQAVHEECYILSVTQKRAVARTKRAQLLNL